MRLRVKQARLSDLNDAVRHAVELEAYNRAEKKKTEGEGYLRTANTANTTEPKPDSQCDKFEILTNTLKLIRDELKSLKTQKPEYRSYRPPGERRPYQRPQPYPKDCNVFMYFRAVLLSKIYNIQFFSGLLVR